MRNDLRIKALRRKFKHTGYSIYNMLLEILTDSDYFRYELNDINYELLAGDLDIDVEELKLIISYLIEIDLLQAESGYLMCKTLENRFNSLLSKRKRERSELSLTITQNNGIIADDNTQSKVKESKGDNSKGEKTKENDINIITTVLSYDNIYLILRNESQSWFDGMCSIHHVKPRTMYNKLEDFINIQKVERPGDRTLKDVRDHFQNWVRKQFEMNPPNDYKVVV